MQPDQSTIVPTIIDRLLSFPLFDGYTHHGVQRVMGTGEQQLATNEALIFREGADADEVVLLISGTLEVFVERNGKEISICQIESGQLVGEIAVLSELPRTASVRAKGEAVLLKWKAAAFRRLLLRDASFSRRIFRYSLRSVIEAEKRLINEGSSEKL